MLATAVLAVAGLAVTQPAASAGPAPKPPKTVSFSAAAFETTEGNGTGCVDVSRSVTKGKSPVVTVATTTGGSATVATDYTAVSATATFARGRSQTSVCVPVLVDLVGAEADETVSLTLTGVTGRGWTLGSQTTTTLTIHEMAAPGAPTDLTVSVVSATVLVPYAHLTWTGPVSGGVDHFVVLSGPAATGPFTVEGTTTSSSFDVTPAPTTDTYYLVEAVNGDNTASDDSNQGFAPGFVPGTGLFWANFFGGQIMAANPDGSGVHPIATGYETPLGVAVDSSHVYWTDYAAGTVTAANLDGTGATVVVAGLNRPYGLAVDAAHLYWSDISDGTISVADLDGSNVSTLVPNQNSPSSVAVDGTHVYWTNWNSPGGVLRRADLDGTDVATLVTDQDNPFAIAVDGSHVYWANAGDNSAATGSIGRANLDGTQATTVASGQAHPVGVAVDGSHLYWANTNTGQIRVAGLDGSNVTTLITDQDGPIHMAVMP